ncbi:MAG TPA: squalene/phytoene synthase family protein [Rhizomicrobium sp.]|jgi:phytoene synthase
MVRKSDPDRYFASLFASADKRRLLFVLYAFNHEIARAAVAMREPMMAEIRLQWWRDALLEACAGQPRAHPVAIGLSELFRDTGVTGAALESLIDARETEISPAPFPDLVALEGHADATAGALMRIAASVLNSDADVEELARGAGTAYAMAGVLRAIPFHAAHGRTFVPADLLAAEGLAANDLLSPRNATALQRVISNLAAVARHHFAQAKRIRIPRYVHPAILPASLVPAYLSHVVRNRRDPAQARGDVSLFRRQLILLRSATLRRL